MEPVLLLLIGTATILGEFNNYGIDTKKYPHLKDVRVRRDLATKLDGYKTDIMQEPEYIENGIIDDDMEEKKNPAYDIISDLNPPEANLINLDNLKIFRNNKGANTRKSTEEGQSIKQNIGQSNPQNVNSDDTLNSHDGIINFLNRGPRITEVDTTFNYILAEILTSTDSKIYRDGEVVIPSNNPANSYNPDSNTNHNAAFSTPNYGLENGKTTDQTRTYQPPSHTTIGYNLRNINTQALRKRRQVNKEIYDNPIKAKYNIEAADKQIRDRWTKFKNNTTVATNNVTLAIGTLNNGTKPNLYNPFNNTSGYKPIYAGYTPYNTNGTAERGYNGTLNGFNALVNKSNRTVLSSMVIGNVGCPQFMKYISIGGLKICTPEEDEE